MCCDVDNVKIVMLLWRKCYYLVLKYKVMNYIFLKMVKKEKVFLCDDEELNNIENEV